MNFPLPTQSHVAAQQSASTGRQDLRVNVWTLIRSSVGFYPGIVRYLTPAIPIDLLCTPVLR
jgi:hypothetical protein